MCKVYQQFNSAIIEAANDANLMPRFSAVPVGDGEFTFSALSHFWVGTPYFLERHIRASRRYEPSCEHADAVFVPFYVGMESFVAHFTHQPQNGAASYPDPHWREFFAHRKRLLPLLGSKPHILPIGRVLEEYRQLWGKTTMDTLADELFILTTIEPDMEWLTGKLSWLRGPKPPVVIIPYNSEVHYVTCPGQEALRSEQNSRDILVFQTWMSRFKLRRDLRTGCALFADKTCFHPEESDASQAQVGELLVRSVFCVQPPGDTSTRHTLYSAAASGCVPRRRPCDGWPRPSPLPFVPFRT